MIQGRFAIRAGRNVLPLDASRFCGFRGKHDVKQVLVILAFLHVGTGNSPSHDVIGPVLDVAEGGFGGFPRIGIGGRGNDFLEGGGGGLGLRVGQGGGNLSDGLGGLKLDGGLVEHRFGQIEGLQVRNLGQTGEHKRF